MASHGGRAPHIVLFLYLDEQRVRQACFQATGCGIAVACASALTELIRGRTLEECRRLQVADLTQALGGIPQTKTYCAKLALLALENALEGLLPASTEERLD